MVNIRLQYQASMNNERFNNFVKLSILTKDKTMEQEEESPATPVAVITIDSDLRKRVRIRVAQLGTTIKSFYEEAILNHLDSQDDHK